jgi:hypothetical protein
VCVVFPYIATGRPYRNGILRGGSICVGFEVLTAVVIKLIKLCSLLKANGRFGEIYRLHHQDRIISQNEAGSKLF